MWDPFHAGSKQECNAKHGKSIFFLVRMLTNNRNLKEFALTVENSQVLYPDCNTLIKAGNIGSHQENPKLLNLYLIFLFLLDLKLSKISKIREETYWFHL